MFEKFTFTSEQIKQYLNSAKRDLKIAQDSSEPEVVFRFSYDALLKLAITIGAQHGLRVKSRAGHHIELMQMLSKQLESTDVLIIGEEMRKKRNLELYNGGTITTKEEAQEYADWVTNVFKLALKNK